MEALAVGLTLKTSDDVRDVIETSLGVFGAATNAIEREYTALKAPNKYNEPRLPDHKGQTWI